MLEDASSRIGLELNIPRQHSWAINTAFMVRTVSRWFLGPFLS
jgi:hypothetical protein